MMQRIHRENMHRDGPSYPGAGQFFTGLLPSVVRMYADIPLDLEQMKDVEMIIQVQATIISLK